MSTLDAQCWDGQLLEDPVSWEGYGHRFPELQSPGLTAQAKSEALGVHWLVEGLWGAEEPPRTCFLI